MKNFIFRNGSIHFRLIISYLVLSISIIGILSYSIYSITETAFEDKISQSEFKVLREVNHIFDLLLNDIVDISDAVFTNKEIQNAIKMRSDNISTDLSVHEFFYSQRMHFSWMGYDTYIFGFNGYSKRFSVRSSAEGFISYDMLKNQSWYDKVLIRDGKIHWVNGLDTDIPSLKDKFLLVRLLVDLSTGNPEGMLVMSFDKKILSNIYDNLFSENVSSVFMVDKKNNYMSFPEYSDINTFALVNEINNTEYGKFTIPSENGGKLVLYQQIKGTDWYIIQTIPLEKFFGFTKNIKNLILLISILCVALSFFFSRAIMRQLYVPIKKLREAMNTVQKGDFQKINLDIERTDEIGQLNHGFIKMVNNLDHLFKRSVIEQKEKRQAEIQMLQAQINPHFLYNTLSTIRCVINVNQKELADKMIIALVKLLKGSLSLSSEFITIEDEIEILKNYILIQKCRYNNFEVFFDIDKELLKCRIPRLILQPLVENSILHGFEGPGYEGNILVSASISSGNIIIGVSDNGIGIAEDKIKDLLDITKVDKRSSIGVKNVQQRILLYYGEPYGLTIETSKKTGTTINLLIPNEKAL